MSFPFGPLLFVIFSGPRGVSDGMERPLVKRLAKKLGASPTPVHPALLTAAGHDGSNPAVALDLLGGLAAPRPLPRKPRYVMLQSRVE